MSDDPRADVILTRFSHGCSASLWRPPQTGGPDHDLAHGLSFADEEPDLASQPTLVR